ncbi:hypothetical protein SERRATIANATOR_16 [Serratia phage vB_SmaS_Serratianator]|nr:hypothetical protein SERRATIANATOR_16 [Serratia phage vB_SmaS_Serratianator]
MTITAMLKPLVSFAFGVYDALKVSSCQPFGDKMIHKTVDELIHKCGGLSKFVSTLQGMGVEITRSGVVKWYTSNQVNPSEKYRESIEKIAKNFEHEIQFEALSDDE